MRNRQSPQAARLAVATRLFLSESKRRFVLRYDPIVDPLHLAQISTALEAEIEIGERRFGRRLQGWYFIPSRLPVYLFGTAQALGHVYGESVGGFASWHDWLIALHAEKGWQETISHELAHIFTGWWNPQAPRLLREGIAVWAQRTWGGRPPDAYIRRRYPFSRMAVNALLGAEPRANDLDQSWYYVLAGGFVGFLIRQAGWEHFRRFYRDRQVTTSTFLTKFDLHYGHSLEDAVSIWYRQLPVSLSFDLLHAD